MRDDIRGRRAPRHLQRFLTRRYGHTLFGEPKFRLVWAPSRFEQYGGVWVDWHPSDSPSARQCGGARPQRRRAEMRWVRKYPGEECWLIERWLPPSTYGSREQWYLPASAGGTVIWSGWAESALPACGPYPARGDYEDIGVRMYWYPSERHLAAAADAVLRRLAVAPANSCTRAQRRTLQAQQEQTRRDQNYEEFCRVVLDDAGQAFGGAPMCGYGGRPRSSSVELCDRIGIRQHP